MDPEEAEPEVKHGVSQDQNRTGSWHHGVKTPRVQNTTGSKHHKVFNVYKSSKNIDAGLTLYTQI